MRSKFGYTPDETKHQKWNKNTSNHWSDASFCVGTELSSRAASRQVLSPLQSLTSVFGMGTGGPSALRAPTQIRCVPYFDVSNELSSRAASRRVLSPLQSLTSVFGMGTGGPSALRSLTAVIKKITENRINENSQAMCCCEPEPVGGSSPRSISISQLKRLLPLHL